MKRSHRDAMPEPPSNDGWLVLVLAGVALFVLVAMLVVTGAIRL
jgi:hypothetical protein